MVSANEIVFKVEFEIVSYLVEDSCNSGGLNMNPNFREHRM